MKIEIHLTQEQLEIVRGVPYICIRPGALFLHMNDKGTACVGYVSSEDNNVHKDSPTGLRHHMCNYVGAFSYKVIE